jgi:hypothetical protein
MSYLFSPVDRQHTSVLCNSPSFLNKVCIKLPGFDVHLWFQCKDIDNFVADGLWFTDSVLGRLAYWRCVKCLLCCIYIHVPTNHFKFQNSLFSLGMFTYACEGYKTNPSQNTTGNRLNNMILTSLLVSSAKCEFRVTRFRLTRVLYGNFSSVSSGQRAKSILFLYNFYPARCLTRSSTFLDTRWKHVFGTWFFLSNVSGGTE